MAIKDSFQGMALVGIESMATELWVGKRSFLKSIATKTKLEVNVLIFFFLNVVKLIVGVGAHS